MSDTVKQEVAFWKRSAEMADQRGETAVAISFRNMAWILEHETEKRLVAQVLREYLMEN